MDASLACMVFSVSLPFDMETAVPTILANATAPATIPPVSRAFLVWFAKSSSPLIAMMGCPPLPEPPKAI